MNSEYKIVGTKSILAGLSAWFIARHLGQADLALRVGVAVAGLNVASYSYTRHLNSNSWIAPDSLSGSWQSITNRVSAQAYNHLFWGLIFLGSGMGQNPTGDLAWVFKYGTFIQSVKQVGLRCVFIPVAQEILFRGFVQEKVEDIQAYFQGSQPDPVGEKKMRVFVQAALFGLTYYSFGPGSGNLLVLLSQGVSGYGLGLIKEEHGIHSSILFHAATSCFATLRVFLGAG